MTTRRTAARPPTAPPKPAAPSERQRRADRIAAILDEHFPAPPVPLDHGDPFQLLVAVILSAQCTDARVNLVTPALFAKAPNARAMAKLTAAEILPIIRTCGLAPGKAKALAAMSRILVDEHHGEVPADLEALERLPGVGHKTASVILNAAFGQPTIAVDTHVFRVANRTGLAPGKNVLEVEKKLLETVPGEFKHNAHHWLILHGRYICQARKPRCGICSINDLCEYEDKVL